MRWPFRKSRATPLATPASAVTAQPALPLVLTETPNAFQPQQAPTGAPNIQERESRHTFVAWARPRAGARPDAGLVAMLDVRREMRTVYTQVGLAPFASLHDQVLVRIHPLAMREFVGSAWRGVGTQYSLPLDLAVSAPAPNPHHLLARFLTESRDIYWSDEELRGWGLTSAAMRLLIAWAQHAYPMAHLSPLKLAEVDGVDPALRKQRNTFYEHLGFTLDTDPEGIAGWARAGTAETPQAVMPRPDPGKVFVHPVGFAPADALVATGASTRVAVLHEYDLLTIPAAAAPLVSPTLTAAL